MELKTANLSHKTRRRTKHEQRNVDMNKTTEQESVNKRKSKPGNIA